jgi:pilus assembly protein CpaD
MIKTSNPWARRSVLGAMSMVVAGCATAPAPTPDPVATEAPNDIQARKVTMTRVVRLVDGEAFMDAAETAELRDFLQAASAVRGTPVQVQTAAGDQKRAAPMIATLFALGYPPMLGSGVGIAPGALRLAIETVVASAPACPNWSQPPGNDAANVVHSDFGCASAANLAAMVADPRDLLIGRDLEAASGDAAVAAIARYRQGVSPGAATGPSAGLTLSSPPAAGP